MTVYVIYCRKLTETTQRLWCSSTAYATVELAQEAIEQLEPDCTEYAWHIQEVAVVSHSGK